MDEVMGMKSHYEMSAEENPTALISATQPFSMDEVKTCPTCRGSLRNIARYGRIVRRAMLDEATKKFISWSHIEYSKLANKLLNVQENMSKFPPPRMLPRSTRPPNLVIHRSKRQKQLQLIRDWVGGERYSEALRLWHQLSTFTTQVNGEEQPFRHVSDFVQYAARQRKLEGDFASDEIEIQHKGYLQACLLSLKCDIVIISDFMELRTELSKARPELTLDLSHQINDCSALAGQAKATKYPRHETEAHVYLAQFCAFSRSLISAELPPREKRTEANTKGLKKRMEDLKDQGLDHLTAACELVETFPGQTQGMAAEIEAAKMMLNDGKFYNFVSPEEMRAIYEAMAQEFLGTGHWYKCLNGHPFTVGECGMPMEEAQCPGCGAPVGGTNHNPAQGVERAEDIEEIAGDLDRVQIW
ncbi:hypothetical protein Hte_006825 [Hypoxylon texense]